MRLRIALATLRHKLKRRKSWDRYKVNGPEQIYMFDLLREKLVFAQMQCALNYRKSYNYEFADMYSELDRMITRCRRVVR